MREFKSIRDWDKFVTSKLMRGDGWMHSCKGSQEMLINCDDDCCYEIYIVNKNSDGTITIDRHFSVADV